MSTPTDAPPALLGPPATKPEPILGRLLTGNPGRDAIHIAIIPTTAQETLRPGQRVTRSGRGVNGSAVSRHAEAAVGIVDPYLRQPVMAGEMFYLCLFPRTVTSLRHAWTHPAYDDERDPPDAA